MENKENDIKNLLKKARDEGHDYPEFKAIEKSIGVVKEGSESHVNEDLSASDFDKVVGRFNQGFNLYQISSMLHVKGATLTQRDKVFNAILSNKDLIIKTALLYLKDGDSWNLNNLIKYARKYGYDYPEFKAIEKSLGVKEGSSQRAFAAGYRDDADIQTITRKKGKKETRNCIVKEDKPKYILGDDYQIGASGIWVTVVSKHHGVRVLFRDDGTIGNLGTREDEDAVNAAKKFFDKDHLLPILLRGMKFDAHPKFISRFIKIARKHGFDYPEFKAMEKSIGE